MAQIEKLSIEEALVFVESKACSTINGELLPFGTQESVMQLLQQDGRDIQTDDNESEVALFAVLVMSLVTFPEGNVLILTTTDEASRAFFEKPLFAENGQTGAELATRCGKTLKLVDLSIDLKKIEVSLNDPNIIPVMDTGTFKQIDEISFDESLNIRQNMSWWKKLISSSPPRPPLREGFTKTIFTSRVSGHTVSAQQGPIVLTVNEWIHTPPNLV